MQATVTLVVNFDEEEFPTDDDFLQELVETIEDNPDFIVDDALVESTS